MAEMVCNEKENSYWFPLQSEICMTDRSRTNLGDFFFNSLHIINNLLVSRNLFTFISDWRAIQLNVHKSDARKISKCRERCIVTLVRVFTENGSWRCRCSRLKMVIQINTLLK